MYCVGVLPFFTYKVGSLRNAGNASGAFVHKTLEMPSFHAFGHKERKWWTVVLLFGIFSWKTRVKLYDLLSPEIYRIDTPIIAMFEAEKYIFQTIILGIYLSFREVEILQPCGIGWCFRRSWRWWQKIQELETLWRFLQFFFHFQHVSPVRSEHGCKNL